MDSALNDFKEVFHSILPCQSSIYTSCQIPRSKHQSASRILLSPIKRNFNVFSCSKRSLPRIEVNEKMFAYLPSNCQIISIDVLESNETQSPIITGIAGATSTTNRDQIQYFFNIYESSHDYEKINIIDSLELEFVPYQLTHTLFNDDQTCFVLSGSDDKIHIFCYNQSTFSEVEAEDLFPEFANELPSIALTLDFMHNQDKSKRYTAVGLECGTFLFFIIDIDDNQIDGKFEYSFQGPVTSVHFFRENEEVQILAVASLSLSQVFYNVVKDGLSNNSVLPGSDEFDVATCCTLADFDFDGRQEILIGTYGEQLLAYKEMKDQTWVLIWQKSFNNPIHQLFYTDLTGDGIKDLFLVTLRAVIILQHDYEQVEKIVQARIEHD